jgi:SAM-dependent methyltransferase
MRKLIKGIPIFGSLARYIYRKLIPPPVSSVFQGSKDYWMDRYESGGNSGAGSYHELADFKAGIINSFVKDNQITSVIEYGCGDGNQLSLAEYPSYIGFDVSNNAILMCRKRFANDQTKTFRLMDTFKGETADLTLSLDVIYHLIEDDVFCEYMQRLFLFSKRFVIIYSSNSNQEQVDYSEHVRHRKFSDWIDAIFPQWKMKQHIPNRYPPSGNTEEGSFADFFIYENHDQPQK